MSQLVKFTDNLSQELNLSLEKINNTQQDALEQASKAIVILQEVMSKLKEFIRTYRFMSVEEEIHFFKNTKPTFLSQLLYHEKVFDLKLNQPCADKAQIQAFYNQSLEHLQQFARTNAKFYQYMLAGSTALDQEYFTCNQADNKPEEAWFHTRHDTTLATLWANHTTTVFIQDELQHLTTTAHLQGMLRWTASKASLIELIYALYYTGSVNSGRDIKSIVKGIEVCFNTRLGNYYKTFQDLRLRKKGQTTFLDHLREKLQLRMDEFD